MHKPESIRENETHKILCDHLISTRRPDLVIVDRKKRICRIVYFDVPVDHRVKIKENEKIKNLDFARELKNYETWKWQ